MPAFYNSLARSVPCRAPAEPETLATKKAQQRPGCKLIDSELLWSISTYFFRIPESHRRKGNVLAGIPKGPRRDGIIYREVAWPASVQYIGDKAYATKHMYPNTNFEVGSSTNVPLWANTSLMSPGKGCNLCRKLPSAHPHAFYSVWQHRCRHIGSKIFKMV